MRLFTTLIIAVLLNSALYAQSNDEIANVYIKKANESMEKIDYKQAKYYFEKAMKYKDTVTTSNVAWLGAHIYLELKEYYKAKSFAKQYFQLKKNKKSEEYSEVLETYVNIEESIFQLEKENAKKEKELQILATKKRKKDSLTQVWKSKLANDFSIKVDSIHGFDSNGVSSYTVKGKFGLMDDKGKVLVAPSEYATYKSSGDYAVFMNNSRYPTKIYVYNKKSKQGVNLPAVTEFNALSDDYGRVMMPRGSGKLVAYPNNSTKVFIYDLKTNKVAGSESFEATIDELKRTDKISKSNKDGQVRVGKDKAWYFFAGDLGGGMYPLITEEFKIAGFLSAVSGKFIEAKNIARVGYFDNGVYETTTKGNVKWIDKKGKVVDAPTVNESSYEGGSKVIRLDENSYYILSGTNIIKEGNSIELLHNFLKNNGAED